MHRPSVSVTMLLINPARRRRQANCARMLVPLIIWICVWFLLRNKFKFSGDSTMMLGPNSSRLFQSNPLFEEQIQVRDEAENGVLVYGFSEMPELNVRVNWSISDYMVVESYNRQNFSLWLNKGSRIVIKWETQMSRLNQIQVSMIKGEARYETLSPATTSSTDILDPRTELLKHKIAEYTIEEDNKYHVNLINQNPKTIITGLTINVSSTMYDPTKAKTSCSTLNGSCKLKLFPDIQYVLLTTPNHGNLNGWYIELSSVARIITYIVILGLIILVIYLMLKFLGACEESEDRTSNSIFHEPTVIEQPQVSENDPLLPRKPMRLTYGTGNEEEDDDDAKSAGSSSSSEDLYDAKLCIICYDDQRNCFFVPCGHCATCYECAQRIMEGDAKVCPICRRLIHKVRRLFNP
ncbi:hypothetical protein ACFE04_005778 [Oxalis oulophora]